MANAPLKTHPAAQPDVPRTAASTLPDEPHGPVDSALAQAVSDLRNAVSAIGPLNFLPKRCDPGEVEALKRATGIILAMVDANNRATP